MYTMTSQEMRIHLGPSQTCLVIYQPLTLPTRAALPQNQTQCQRLRVILLRQRKPY